MKFRAPVLCSIFRVVGAVSMIAGVVMVPGGRDAASFTFIGVGLLWLAVAKALDLLARIAFDTQRTADHIAALNEQPSEDSAEEEK
jgi:hypothetical protein